MDAIRLLFAGDLMPGGVVLDDSNVFSDDIYNLFSEAELRIATLECAIGENMSFDQVKMENPLWRNIIYAPDRAIDKLKELNINIVSLANNHIYDLGEDGLRNTINLLKKNSIKYVGAGLNDEEASSPAVFNIKGKTLAFLAYMEPYWRAPHPAGVDSPGINLLQMDKVLDDVRKAKEKYDYVFVLPHWGVEYTYFPLAVDRKKAWSIVKAGADGIIGSHTHQIQPWIRKGKSFIFFSLGNFLFPDFFMLPERPICYPQKNDFDKYPVSYEYPRNPNGIVRRVWKLKNRIGLLATIDISDRLSGSATFIELDKDNRVVLLKNNRKYLYILKTISILIKTPFYKYFTRAKNLYVKIINKIKGHN